MSNQLATQPRSKGALGVMATRFSVEPAKLLSTLKSTVFKGASDDELMALCIVANEYGLNPMLKEIYAFPAKGGGIVPVVSVDGWINIINSHPQMDGLDFEMEDDADGQPIKCTAIIYRKDRTRPVRVTEYYAECRRNTEPWKMAHRMLRHKALIQCARVAFGFSGIFDEDEGNDIKTAQGVVIEKPEFTGEAKALPFAEAVEAPPRDTQPRDATPREKLENLMKSSHIQERDILQYVAEVTGEENETLGALDLQTMNDLIASWEGVVESITKGTK